MDQNPSNLQSYWKKFINLNSANSSLQSTASNNQQTPNKTHSSTIQTNDNDIGSCASGLDGDAARKLKDDLDRAREQSSLNYSAKSRCLVA